MPCKAARRDQLSPPVGAAVSWLWSFKSFLLSTTLFSLNSFAGIDFFFNSKVLSTCCRLLLGQLLCRPLLARPCIKQSRGDHCPVDYTTRRPHVALAVTLVHGNVFIIFHRHESSESSSWKA